MVIIIDWFLEENEKGLWHASIIDSYLIDFYVPFLPLEREHVRNCIRAEFRNYNLTNELILASDGPPTTGSAAVRSTSPPSLNADLTAAYQVTDYDIEHILDEHVFEPPGYKKYSSSGCKRVPFLVRTFISKRNFRLNEEL